MPPLKPVLLALVGLFALVNARGESQAFWAMFQRQNQVILACRKPSRDPAGWGRWRCLPDMPSGCSYCGGPPVRPGGHGVPGAVGRRVFRVLQTGASDSAPVERLGWAAPRVTRIQDAGICGVCAVPSFSSARRSASVLTESGRLSLA